MEHFGIFYGHLAILCPLGIVYLPFLHFWTGFPVLGVLFQEQFGNPALNGGTALVQRGKD
jgi:hypothetical protein